MDCLNQVHEKHYSLFHGDCCEVIQGIPDESVGYSIFSPPFSDLYAYSDSDRDMGNARTYDEFFEHFGFLIKHLLRVLQPGRLVSVHCMDLPTRKSVDGFIGIRDFSGDVLRAFQKGGFIYASKHVIWKDPLNAAVRTKAIGLLHKQLCKDSSLSRAGLPDYVITLRKPGENKKPISHPDGLTHYAGADTLPPGNRSHNIWRAYASPVWMDIRQTHTLNYRSAKDQDDEKHICPLQLDTIERCITLWSNPGDVVLTPFMGIGSEVFMAVQLGRRGLGIELKKSYFRQAVKNLHGIGVRQEQSLGILER